MPIYTYLCEKCQTRFEAFASLQKKESGWKPDCPKCGSSHVRQTFGPVAMVGSKRQPPPGSGCCSNRGG